MRKKIFVGLFLAVAMSLAAGDYLFNRSGAQDAPKKDVEEKKNDLFETLKKDLEAKKDVPPPFPPVNAIPQDVPPPSLPVMPALPNNLAPAPVTAPTPPAPVTVPQAPTLPTPSVTPPAQPTTPQAPTLPTPSVTPPAQPITPQAPTLPTPSVTPPAQPISPPAVDGAKVPITVPPLSDKKPENVSFPALDKAAVPAKSPLPPVISTNVPVQVSTWVETKDGPREKRIDPAQPIANEVAKIKDCPWSLQIDMVDGRTVVTATVNKKHEFKIVCQNLDLQTANGTLKATGKVQITGDAFDGSCDQLAIPLMEDRLILEGKAVVRIQKTLSNVSDAKPAAFELKGETLNVRISELPSSVFQPTSLPKVDSDVKQAVSVTPVQNETWSPAGKLRRVKSQEHSARWCLENKSGEIIAYLTVRQGGSLEQYVGQSISVLGTRMFENGSSVIRVTHIALP